MAQVSVSLNLVKVEAFSLQSQPYLAGSPCPLSMLVLIARSSAPQSTRAGGQGKWLLSVGSEKGTVLCNLRNGWPKHFDRDCIQITLQFFHIGLSLIFHFDIHGLKGRDFGNWVGKILWWIRPFYRFLAQAVYNIFLICTICTYIKSIYWLTVKLSLPSMKKLFLVFFASDYYYIFLVMKPMNSPTCLAL